MPRKRSHLAGLIAERSFGAISVVEARDGWPSTIAVTLPTGTAQQVDCYMAPIGLSFRGRDNVERRFQNPGKNRPIKTDASRQILYIGVWEDDPVIRRRSEEPILVIADAKRRVGSGSRASVFPRVAQLGQAELTGWAEFQTSNGESFIYTTSALLPAFAQMTSDNTYLKESDVATIAQAVGLISGTASDVPERARRQITALVRDAKFRKEVTQAYRGLCAMCGFDFGLVEAAHIYPAAAPDSHDAITNGVALCRNHHAAFDRHEFRVDPETLSITPSTHLLSHSNINSACAAFIETTYSHLNTPSRKSQRPARENWIRRYEYFGIIA